MFCAFFWEVTDESPFAFLKFTCVGLLFSVSPAIKLSEYMLRKEGYLPTRALSRQHLWSVLGYVNLIFFCQIQRVWGWATFWILLPFGFGPILSLCKCGFNCGFWATLGFTAFSAFDLFNFRIGKFLVLTFSDLDRFRFGPWAVCNLPNSFLFVFYAQNEICPKWHLPKRYKN